MKNEIENLLKNAAASGSVVAVVFPPVPEIRLLQDKLCEVNDLLSKINEEGVVDVSEEDLRAFYDDYGTAADDVSNYQAGSEDFAGNNSKVDAAKLRGEAIKAGKARAKAVREKQAKSLNRSESQKANRAKRKAAKS